MLINRYLFSTFLLSQCALLAHTDPALSIDENDIMGYSAANVGRANPGLVQQYLIDRPEALDELKDKPQSAFYETVSQLDEGESVFFLHRVLDSLNKPFLPGFSWVYGMSPGVDWRATYNASPAMQKGFESRFKLPSTLPEDKEEKACYEAMKGRFAQDWILATQEYDPSIKPDFEVKYTNQADLLKHGSRLFSKDMDTGDKDVILDAVRTSVDSNRYEEFSNSVASVVVDRDLSTKEKFALISLLGQTEAANYDESVDALYTLMTRVIGRSVRWDKVEVIDHILHNSTTESALSYMKSVNDLLADTNFNSPGQVMAALTEMAGEERDYEKAAIAVGQLLDGSSASDAWANQQTVELLGKMGPGYKPFLALLNRVVPKEENPHIYIRALQAVAPEDHQAFVDAVVPLMADALDSNRLTIIDGIQGMAGEGKNYGKAAAVAKGLLDRASDSNPHLFGRTLKLLGEMGPEYEMFLDILYKLLPENVNTFDIYSFVGELKEIAPGNRQAFVDAYKNLVDRAKDSESLAKDSDTYKRKMIMISLAGEAEDYDQFLALLNTVLPDEFSTSMLSSYVDALKSVAPDGRQAYVDFLKDTVRSDMDALDRQKLVIAFSNLKSDDYGQFIKDLESLTSGMPEEKMARFTLDLSKVPSDSRSEFMGFLQEIDFEEWKTSFIGYEIRYLAELFPNHHQAFKDVYNKLSAPSLSAETKKDLVFDLSKLEPDNYELLLAALGPHLEGDGSQRDWVPDALEALNYYNDLSPEDYSKFLNNIFPLMGDSSYRNLLIGRMMEAVGRDNWQAFSENAKTEIHSLDTDQLEALRKVITADNFVEELNKAFETKSPPLQEQE